MGLYLLLRVVLNHCVEHQNGTITHKMEELKIIIFYSCMDKYNNFKILNSGSGHN